jgi:hypothetical protein
MINLPPSIRIFLAGHTYRVRSYLPGQNCLLPPVIPTGSELFIASDLLRQYPARKESGGGVKKSF